jgi:indolepyruvate ferredoxin oxidoreductase
VHIHCRIGEKPSDINAIRVATGECDALIGGDLVVSAGAKTLGLMKTGRTKGVVNSHEIITGDFTRNTEFRLPSDELKVSLAARLSDGLAMFDASDLAKALLGDSIYSNMMVFGAAWQMGAIPVGYEAILQAIKLNGAAVDRNIRAFELGRWAYLHPADAQALLSPNVVALPKSTEEKITFREAHLMDYQGKRLAKRYRKMVDRFTDDGLRLAVATGYHKLLAYKDEYEVARLLTQTEQKAKAEFDGDLKLTYHLAPPMLTKTGPDGRPAKKEFGARMASAFPKLAKLKFLRGTPFDPFGRTAERRMERALIAEYEADMAEVLQIMRPDTRDAAIALAALPREIRGFGPVKEANARKAAKRREELLAVLRATPMQQAAE